MAPLGITFVTKSYEKKGKAMAVTRSTGSKPSRPDGARKQAGINRDWAAYKRAALARKKKTKSTWRGGIGVLRDTDGSTKIRLAKDKVLRVVEKAGAKPMNARYPIGTRVTRSKAAKVTSKYKGKGKVY